jgi:hypothetical protein
MSNPGDFKLTFELNLVVCPLILLKLRRLRSRRARSAVVVGQMRRIGPMETVDVAALQAVGSPPSIGDDFRP